MYFSQFRNYPPWKRSELFIWTNLNPLHPKMISAKFGWNCLNGSGEYIFFQFVNVFLQFRNYFSLQKGGGLYLNKIEPPSPKDELCQVWLKLARWFMRRRFFKFVNIFSQFRNYFSFEKGGVLHLKKLTSLTPRMLCAKFGWNLSSGSSAHVS